LGYLFTLEDINNLRHGLKANHQVATLHESIQRQLSWKSPIVYLSAQSLAHINTNHPDISDIDLLLLPKIISDGLLVQEIKKPNILLACLQLDEERRLITSLKRADNGFDIWISSLYRMRRRQTLSILRRGRIIRTHK